jgi:SAM-dependent methyltransferase
MIPLLAELVAPSGRVLAGDISPAMVEAAVTRSEQSGSAGVEVAELALDWVDLPSASAGALVSRFGYMFADDPAAALIEARRVLRPGGRFATAVWDRPEVNPYGVLPLKALAEVGLADLPKAGDAGMFRLARPGLIGQLLLDAGFTDVVVRPIEVSFTFDSFNGLLEWLDDHSQRVTTALAEGVSGSVEEFHKELKKLVEPFTRADGRITLPGVSLVASARA